jgi:hypothetical protein
MPWCVDRHDDQVSRAATTIGALLAATDIGLVDFHAARQHFAIGADHRASEFVHPRPRCLVRTEPENPLQTERADAVLSRGHEPHRREARPQRLLRTMEDRSRGRRRPPLTARAHPQTRRGTPRVSSSARRAHEPVRPPQPREVLDARRLVNEPALQELERRGQASPDTGRSALTHPATSAEQIRGDVHQILHQGIMRRWVDSRTPVTLRRPGGVWCCGAEFCYTCRGRGGGGQGGARC